LPRGRPRAAADTGSDFIRIAQGGIGLVDGYDAPIGKRGMEKQFTRLGSFGSPKGDTPFGGLGGEKPDVVVVNLGTNDGNRNEKNPAPMTVFRDATPPFWASCEDLPRRDHPRSGAVQPQWGQKRGDPAGCGAPCSTTGDQRTRTVSTDGWVNPDPAGGDIAPDWSHPTDAGHEKLARRMTQVLTETFSLKETKP
jgi:lysophospholipase L1-like esterase